MKQTLAFFRLVRWPNLVFIVLTQVLFRYAVVLPVFKEAGINPLLSTLNFQLIVLASVLIAAGGYVINDYFDVNIDRINKPDKLVLERSIRRKSAILLHLFLSLAGIVISFASGWNSNHDVVPGICNTISVLLLLFYSTTYKKRLLTGNLIISFLTAWVLLVLYLFEMPRLFYSDLSTIELQAMSKLLRITILYASFAFIISLIREVLKDAEDMEGDGKNGCKTIPLEWGIRGAKIFVFVWIVVLGVALVFLQVYVMFFQWWLSIIYSIVLILLPMVKLFVDLKKASKPTDFTPLSFLVKLIMLSGITSLIFFYYYA